MTSSHLRGFYGRCCFSFEVGAMPTACGARSSFALQSSLINEKVCFRRAIFVAQKQLFHAIDPRGSLIKYRYSCPRSDHEETSTTTHTSHQAKTRARRSCSGCRCQCCKISAILWAATSILSVSASTDSLLSLSSSSSSSSYSFFLPFSVSRSPCMCACLD